MKKKLSYDEEMTLLLELTDSMDEGDRECFTLEEAERMVADQHTYERTHGLPEGEYDPQFWFDTIRELIWQDAAENEEDEDNSDDINPLKYILFSRVKAEMDAYHDMSHAPEYNTYEDIQRQRVRFCSVWQVLEEAELVDEYDAWKNAGGGAK